MFDRPLAVLRAQRMLEERSFPRLQMTLIAALTGGFGLLPSFDLLRHLGAETMALRYPLPLVLAYGMFLFLIWLWLKTNARDYIDLVDLPNCLPPDGGGAPGPSFGSAGRGGDFGGGGASASFDGPALCRHGDLPGHHGHRNGRLRAGCPVAGRSASQRTGCQVELAIVERCSGMARTQRLNAPR